MKKTYSIILLIAYLVGTIQPIMPMFQLELDGDDVIEYVISQVLCVQDAGTHFASLKVKDNKSSKSPNKKLKLVRDSFYPVGVEISTAHNPVPYVKKKMLYLAVDIQASDPIYFPNSPPPQLS